MKKVSLSIALLLTSTMVFSFDFGSLNSVVESGTKMLNEKKSSNSSGTSSLSDSLVTSGLKEALKIGVDFGIKELGKKDGYLSNSNAKIELPQNLANVESLIRKAGGGKIADDLILSMNKAATKAAPKTADIFMSAIEKMNLNDAKKILAGDKNAASEYFQKNTNTSLKKMITPIIQDSMKENDVASYYETFNKYYSSHAKGIVENSQVMGFAKQFGADKYIPSSDEKLDDYVTQQAIDGLFEMISEKEAEIRKESSAQTTSLLKKVFGN